MKRYRLLLCVLINTWMGTAYAYEFPSCDDPAAEEIVEPVGGYTGYIAKYDGFIMGADGCFYDYKEFSIADIEPFMAENGDPDLPPIWVVNGGNSQPKKLYVKMQLLAEVTGQAVIGIYNGYFDEFELKDTHLSIVPDVLLENMNLALDVSQTVHLYGGSLAPIFLARALFALERDLLESGFTKRQVRRYLGGINVETIGGAQSHYPDGPKYVHYVNRLDPAPKVYGVLKLGTHPGRSAVVVLSSFVRFDSVEPDLVGEQWDDLDVIGKWIVAVHGFGPYIDDRLPFDVIRSFARRTGLPRYIRRDRVIESSAYQE